MDADLVSSSRIFSIKYQLVIYAYPGTRLLVSGGAQNIGKRRIVEGALEGGVVFRPQYPNLFAAFWCENEYRLCLFWSGIWYGF